MKYEHLIYQILSSWIGTLQIDGGSGESIVTVEDIDRLYADLTVTFDTLGQRRNPWRLPLTFLRNHGGYLRHTLRKSEIMMNIFRPS